MMKAFLLSAVLLISADAAFAQTYKDTETARIVANETLVGAEGAHAYGEAPFFEQALLPIRSAVVTEAGATDSIVGPRQPIPVGQQLFIVRQNDADYGCFLRGGDNQTILCLTDTNGDGRFDRQVAGNQTTSGIALFPPRLGTFPLGRMVQTGVFQEGTEPSTDYTHHIGIAVLRESGSRTSAAPIQIALVVRGSRDWMLITDTNTTIQPDVSGLWRGSLLGAEIELQTSAESDYRFRVVRPLPDQAVSFNMGREARAVSATPPLLLPR